MDSKPFFDEVYGNRSYPTCGSQYAVMSPTPATPFSLFAYPQLAGDAYTGPVLGGKDELMLYDEPNHFASPDYAASPFSGEPESPFLLQKHPSTAWPPHTPTAEMYGRSYFSFPSTEPSGLGLQPFASGPELSLPLHHTVSPQEVLSTPSPPALSLSPSSLSSPLAPPSPSVENIAIVPSQDERSPLLRIRIPASGDRQLRPQVRANRSFSEEPRPQAVPAPVSVSTGGGRQPRGRVMRTISDPMPVPNLTKKSRGRRVPTTDGPAIPTNDSGKPRLFVCEVPDCGKCFQRSEHLKRHVRSIHTYDKPFACDFPHCSAKFARRDNLAQHRSIHSSRSAPRSSGYDD